jgi:hypothetical protein
LDSSGDYVYSLAGACTEGGLCIGLADTAADEVEVVNTVPVLFLAGPKTISIDKTTPWTVCLPGVGAGEICDRGISAVTSNDPEEGAITNAMITVCGDDIKFGTSHPTFGGSHLADVCGFNVNEVGSFTIEYAWTDNWGLRGSATRTINVLQVCDAPEFVCISDKTLCSTGGFCIGDPVGVVDDTPEDMAPVLSLNNVVDVIGAEVRVRRYKTYAPCGLDTVTGLNIVPTVTTYGDGLCDPGLTANDIKAELVDGVYVNNTVPLTQAGPLSPIYVPLSSLSSLLSLLSSLLSPLSPLSSLLLSPLSSLLCPLLLFSFPDLVHVVPFAAQLPAECT